MSSFSSSSSSSTGASLLLFSLFMVFLAFTVALPSPKDDGGILLPLIQEQIYEASSTSSSSSAPVDAWSQCVNIPVLDETCISIEVIPDNLTLIITLTIHNVTLVHTQLSATQICLDQGSLLRLLDLIPVLAPFKTLINYLIKVNFPLQFFLVSDLYVIRRLY
jgi:hypothetical protein